MAQVKKFVLPNCRGFWCTYSLRSITLLNYCGKTYWGQFITAWLSYISPISICMRLPHYLDGMLRPSIIFVLKPLIPIMLFGGGDLVRLLGLGDPEVGPPCWNSCSYKRKRDWKLPLCKDTARRSGSLDWPAPWSSQPPELWEKFLLLKPPSLWDFVVAA